jgi:hypothetical protein
MSRSHARFPLSIMCGPDSLAAWKRQGNRLIRRRVRQHLHAHRDDPDLMLPNVDEVMNPWGGPRDGWGRYDPFSSQCLIHGEPRQQTPFEHYRQTRMK